MVEGNRSAPGPVLRHAGFSHPMVSPSNLKGLQVCPRTLRTMTGFNPDDATPPCAQLFDGKHRRHLRLLNLGTLARRSGTAVEVALPCACLAHDDPHGIEQLGRESIARMAELGGGDARHYTTCEPSALLQGMQPCSRPPQRPSSAVSLTIDEGMSRDDAV